MCVGMLEYCVGKQAREAPFYARNLVADKDSALTVTESETRVWLREARDHIASARASVPMTSLGRGVNMLQLESVRKTCMLFGLPDLHHSGEKGLVEPQTSIPMLQRCTGA